MKTKWTRILFMGLGFALAAARAGAQSRGVSIVDTQGAQVASFSGSYALVIGESAYHAGWPALAGVKDDTSAVKSLFEGQGFAVTLVEDKTSKALKGAIEDFFDQYGYDADARLLIYYAGHGQTLQQNGRDMGYIVPIDAPLDTHDKRRFQQLAISMDDFDGWAKKIASKHVLFVFDSCFSGTIFNASRGAPPSINHNIGNPVRQFIASGQANETVPDKSIFRRQLEAALRDKEADADKDGYVTGTELGYFLQTQVINYSEGSQHPQYGKTRTMGLDKGDFVFEVGRHEMKVSQTVTQELTIGSVSVPPGSMQIDVNYRGALSISGGGLNQKIADLPDNAMLPVPSISAGTYTLRMEYPDGETEEVRVTVRSNETAAVEFEYQPALALTDPAAPLRPSPQPETQRRFSGGRKFGAGVLNLALGLGSFTVGDAGGGLLNNLNIGIIPDSRGVKAVQVLYQKSF
ncbi:MAG: caspase family protein [Treponema sp.]|jgi:hypothetical protein|nr:caspase family protein [Treponema sp.]